MVVAILGILAVVAVQGFTRYARNARKTTVISELSAITLRETSFLGISGHYASTTNCETPTCTYPQMGEFVSNNGATWTWGVEDDGYTAANGSGAYFFGGPNLHGFDALRYLPEGSKSHCGYAVISGHGSDGVDSTDEPPNTDIGSATFPAGEADEFRARDWFYAYALCDLDYDGDGSSATFYSAYTITSYDSKVNATSVGDYREGE